jgi:hypothetical protein
MANEIDEKRSAESLTDRYSRLASKYKAIVRLEDSEIKLIEEDASKRDNSDSDFDNGTYFMITSFVGLTYFSGIFIVFWQLQYAQQLADRLVLQAEIQQFGKNHFYLFLIIMIMAVSITTYTALPLLISVAGRRNLGPFSVRWRSVSYLAFAIALNYFIGWIFIVSLSATGIIEASIMKWIFVVWIMLLAPIFFFGPGMIAMLLFLTLISRGNNAFYRRTYNNKISCPAVIIEHLLILIDEIPQRSAPSVAFDSVKKETLDRIEFIANAIWGMSRLNDARGVEGEGYRRVFLSASSAFRSLSNLVLMPRSGGFGMLRQYSIRFLNVFLSGNYDSLPQNFALLATRRANIAKKSIMYVARSLGALMLFLLIPVIVWLLVQYFHNFEIDSLARTFLTIVYTCWCVLGIASLADEFAPGAKEVVLATLKLFIPKSG